MLDCRFPLSAFNFQLFRSAFERLRAAQRRTRTHSGGSGTSFARQCNLNRHLTSSSIVEQGNAPQHYLGRSGHEYHRQRALPAVCEKWVEQLRAEKIQPYVKETDVVFEYGCGVGWNLAKLRCHRKLGYDVSDFLEPQLRARQIEFVTSPNDLADASVDVLLIHHALEHMLEPLVVLQSVHRLLKPTGKLLIFVPFEKERKYRTFRRDDQKHHLYSWTPRSIGNLVQTSGYKVLDVQTLPFRFDRFAAIWAARLNIGEVGFRCLRRALLLIGSEDEIQLIANR